MHYRRQTDPLSKSMVWSEVSRLLSSVLHLSNEPRVNPLSSFAVLVVLLSLSLLLPRDATQSAVILR